ncbi:hypothetical protein KEJ37_00180 [Candidatus Bathyarchaeota archaeon]|nr:hypothetical protein [Candidatus Bathyarchaeota archaeon]
MKIITRKAYPFRSFYEGKERLAFYVINILGEEPQVTIYSDMIKKVNPEIDSLGVRKSEFENDTLRVQEFLEKYFPEELAEAIFKYARKDLGCKDDFSLKAYISWKGKQP